MSLTSKHRRDRKRKSQKRVSRGKMLIKAKRKSQKRVSQGRMRIKAKRPTKLELLRRFIRRLFNDKG